MDVVLCFPPLLLALLVVTLLGPGAATLIPVLALVYLPGFVRVVYAGVLSVRAHEYVEAMRALGAGPAAHHAAHHPAEYRRPDAGAVQPRRRVGRRAGIGPVLPRPRRGAAGAVLGPDDRAPARSTMAQAPLLLLWPCLALTPDHPGDERAVRRAARRASIRIARRAGARCAASLAALAPGLLPDARPACWTCAA